MNFLKIKVGKNLVKFSKVEWFKMYSIHDNRVVGKVVGKVGNMLFANYGNFDVQSYIDGYVFSPLSSAFTFLVKIDFVTSEKLYEMNDKTGIFETDEKI